jgi:hypothetical protein
MMTAPIIGLKTAMGKFLINVSFIAQLNQEFSGCSNPFIHISADSGQGYLFYPEAFLP